MIPLVWVHTGAQIIKGLHKYRYLQCEVQYNGTAKIDTEVIFMLRVYMSLVYSLYIWTS